jgi:hypothetical protein
MIKDRCGEAKEKILLFLFMVRKKQQLFQKFYFILIELK